MEKDKKDILIVSSSFEEFKNDLTKGSVTSEGSHYPLGMAYLHSYLESQNIKIKTLFLNHHSYRECFERVNEAVKINSPEIVGLNILTANRISSYRIIESLHENYPKIKIIIGGIHSTIMYEQLLKKFPYIFVALGDGELTLAEFVKKVKSKSNLNKINGLVSFENGKIIRNPLRELITDLDILPFPKHDLFFKDSNRTSACIMTSRGCPFNCSFCCLNPVSKRRVRFRSVKNVVDEIEYLIYKWPKIKEIWIHDDTLFVINSRAIELCNEIVKRGIKKDFVCSGRMKPINKELVNALERAGFTRVLLGLESGDNGILEKCGKNITQKDVLHTFKLFQKTSISLKPFIIIGLPGETWKTIKESIRFIKKLQKIKYMSYSDACILAIYPGTEVYDLSKKAGLIDDSFWLTDKQVPLYTVENNLEKMSEFREEFLNNLSTERFFTTPKGFKSQFVLTPYLLKYIFWTKRKTLLSFIRKKILV